MFKLPYVHRIKSLAFLSNASIEYVDDSVIMNICSGSKCMECEHIMFMNWAQSSNMPIEQLKWRS